MNAEQPSCDCCGHPEARRPAVVPVRIGAGEVGLPCLLCDDCWARFDSIKQDLAQRLAEDRVPPGDLTMPDFLRGGPPTDKVQE